MKEGVICLGAKARRLARFGGRLSAVRSFIVSVWIGKVRVSSRQCFAGGADFGYRNDDAMKSTRYQVFTVREEEGVM